MQNLRRAPRTFETIGRFLTCLLDMTSVGHTTEVRGLHVWQIYEGGLAVEWTGGPHAREILEELRLFAADDAATTVLSPGDISDVEEIGTGVQFRVAGILFQLRPVETIGVAALDERVLGGPA